MSRRPERRTRSKASSSTAAQASGGSDNSNTIRYDAEEAHAGAGGKYVKSLVFGGLDGIITTFAVVAASKGGSLSTEIVLLMGFANLFADGLSMGFGDFCPVKRSMNTRRRRKSGKMGG